MIGAVSKCGIQPTAGLNQGLKFIDRALLKNHKIRPIKYKLLLIPSRLFTYTKMFIRQSENKQMTQQHGRFVCIPFRTSWNICTFTISYLIEDIIRQSCPSKMKEYIRYLFNMHRAVSDKELDSYNFFAFYLND